MAIHSCPLGLAVWVIRVRVGHAEEEKLFTLPGAIHSTLSDRRPTVLLYGPSAQDFGHPVTLDDLELYGQEEATVSLEERSHSSYFDPRLFHVSLLCFRPLFTYFRYLI